MGKARTVTYAGHRLYMNTSGIHLLCEFNGCNPSILADACAIQQACEAAARLSKATVLRADFHEFLPNGVSGFLFLAESHISIHTWPEHKYAAVDIYTCGTLVSPRDAIPAISASLGASDVHLREILRGLPVRPGSYASREVSSATAVLADNNDSLINAGKKFWLPGSSSHHERHCFEVREWIASARSQYQQIEIVRNEAYGRMLFLDGAVQSAESDEYMYHEALVHPAMTLHHNPQRVLILGGGEGASLREALRHSSVKRAVMVDIDGMVVEMCRQHLPEWSAGAFDDPRSEVIIADGQRWVEACAEQFDIILMDLTDQIEVGSSFPLYTREFYECVQSRLAPGGMLVVQAGELCVCEYFSHCTIRRTLATTFRYVTTYMQHIPSFVAQWSWIIASNDDLTNLRNSRVSNARVNGDLNTITRFYDQATHLRMFTLPRDIAELLDKAGMIITSDEASMEAYKIASATRTQRLYV